MNFEEEIYTVLVNNNKASSKIMCRILNMALGMLEKKYNNEKKLQALPEIPNPSSLCTL